MRKNRSSQKIVYFIDNLAKIVSYIKTKQEQIKADYPLHKKLEAFRKINKDEILKSIITAKLRELLKTIYPSLKKIKTFKRNINAADNSSKNANDDKQPHVNYVCNSYLYKKCKALKKLLIPKKKKRGIKLLKEKMQ